MLAQDEHIASLEDMLERTTQYMQRIQDELAYSKALLEKKNKSIDESLNYSSLLRCAISPNEEFLKTRFKECFLVDKPIEKIGGDTIWYRNKGGVSYLSSIDCTGHGIPGAMLTMAAHYTLNSVFESLETLNSDEFVTHVMRKFNDYLMINQVKPVITDSMDMSLCIIDHEKHKLSFSGVNHGLIQLTGDSLTEHKGTKVMFREFDQIKIEMHEITFGKNDIFYVQSDGFKDQLGGERLKKFGRNRLYGLLSSMSRIQLKKQKDLLLSAHAEWKGNGSQTDDILLFGFKP